MLRTCSYLERIRLTNIPHWYESIGVKSITFNQPLLTSPPPLFLSPLGEESIIHASPLLGVSTSTRSEVWNFNRSEGKNWDEATQSGCTDWMNISFLAITYRWDPCKGQRSVNAGLQWTFLWGSNAAKLQPWGGFAWEVLELKRYFMKQCWTDNEAGLQAQTVADGLVVKKHNLVWKVIKTHFITFF